MSVYYISIKEKAGRLTNTGLFGGCPLVAIVALAVVRSRCVDTVAIDTWITHTLIHIWRDKNKVH